MAGQVVFVDTYRIREGKLDEFKQATEEIVAFVGTNEPQLIENEIAGRTVMRRGSWLA